MQFGAPQLPQYVLDNAGFLCDKHAMLCAEIKERPCMFCW